MSCLHFDCLTFLSVSIFKSVTLVDMYCSGTPHSNAVGACLPLKYQSVDLLDQGTLMEGRPQRRISLVSLGFYQIEKRV